MQHCDFEISRQYPTMNPGDGLSQVYAKIDGDRVTLQSIDTSTAFKVTFDVEPSQVKPICSIATIIIIILIADSKGRYSYL